MSNSLPNHVGFIMDGNRRWAEANGKSIKEGYRQGYKTLREVLLALKARGIQYSSIYSFSTENWKRQQKHVNSLFAVMKWVLEHEMENILKEDIRIIMLGKMENFDSELLKLFRKLEKKSKQNKSGTLGVCFNYGGQQEIADAANKAKKQNPTGDITVESITANLYGPEIPPLDLIIRPSGEQRLSNFMLWRATYSELYYTNKLWPEFTVNDLDIALKDYQNRQRRFGK